MSRAATSDHYPTHLLAGTLVCGVCNATVGQVSGKSGGYYGCLGASKGACENKLLVRRTLAERIILAAVRDRLAGAGTLRDLLARVAKEVEKLYSHLPETLRLKQAELEAEERRVKHFVDFVAEGRGTRALAEALAVAERRADELRLEVDAMTRTREAVFKTPPLPWVEERVTRLQEFLERRTERAALLLRKLLGQVRMEPTQGDIGRPYYRAVSNLQVLALLEAEPEDPSPSGEGPEGGSNSLRWWTRSQLCRTAGQEAFEVAILEVEPPPSYQRLAPEAARLRRLGLSLAAIARHLSTTDKTVAKAAWWFTRIVGGLGS